MIKNVVTFFLMSCAFVASADELALVNSFIQCKPAFFNILYDNREELQQHTELRSFGKNQAYISVPNRSNNNQNYIYFKTPIMYNTLKIKGYYDSEMDLGSMGKYYFWGFIIDNDLDEIRRVFNSLDWKNMENNTLYISNAKIRFLNDDVHTWKENTGTVVGVKTIPAPDTTEKLLLLEKGPDMTLLTCSIQGLVSPELLKIERPDIQ